MLRTTPEDAVAVVRAREAERRELDKAARAASRDGAVDAAALAARAEDVGGIPVVLAAVEVDDAKTLPDVADRVKGQLGRDGVIALGSVIGDRASIVVSVAPSLVERGIKAGAIAKAAATVLGGGGGGRDTLAQAGGGSVDKLQQALDRARASIAAALGG